MEGLGKSLGLGEKLVQRPWGGPDPGVGRTGSSSLKVLETNPRAACFPGVVVPRTWGTERKALSCLKDRDLTGSHTTPSSPSSGGRPWSRLPCPGILESESPGAAF